MFLPFGGSSSGTCRDGDQEHMRRGGRVTLRRLAQKTRYTAAVAALVATKVLAPTMVFTRLLGTKSMSSAETGISAVLPRKRAFNGTGRSAVRSEFGEAF